MAKNTTNIYFGPMTQVQVSSSDGAALDIGYVDGADITYEPAPITINDGQQFQGTGLAKVEVRAKQSDSTNMGYFDTMMDEEAYFIITDVAGKVYTCGPALANVATARSFEAGEGHIVTVTLQKQVAAESDFIVIT
jgi:hypothetical protein